MKKKIKVSIIILTWDLIHMTTNCVYSLLKILKDYDWEIIFVDNQSTDGTQEWLRFLENKYPNVKVLINNQNLGYAASINRGLKIATGKYIWLLNNDTIVNETSLNGLIKPMEEDEKLGIVASCTNFVGNPLQSMLSPSEIKNLVIQCSEVHFVSVLLRKKMVDEIGLLDSEYISGFEDSDYTYLAKKNGWKVAVSMLSFVYHFGSQTIKEKLDFKKVWKLGEERFKMKWGNKEAI